MTAVQLVACGWAVAAGRLAACDLRLTAAWLAVCSLRLGGWAAGSLRLAAYGCVACGWAAVSWIQLISLIPLSPTVMFILGRRAGSF
ncbi:hypothetical protein [Paenibacillus lignilyticus]|uniref:Uncharacterized protein n=1 Tax=Paenibacillus lignilyticus TaxID=1172615 RepID=A0ABS5CJN7_9BACL|nr:hypothetical protein [Paenibacillus lignilyticus]MBP3966073.1 hypothetical protein [Paenibacillus lignilyticus]